MVVFKLEPNESSKDGLWEAVLLALEQALNDFIESLKEDYDKSEDRMIFVSVYSQAFINGALFMVCKKSFYFPTLISRYFSKPFTVS